MLKIRLQRVGRKHDPSYRIILADVKQGPKSGKSIENLGSYDARKDVKQVKGERIKYWIDHGAQVSDTVHNILVSEKVVEGKKINVLPKKTPIKKEVNTTLKEEKSTTEEIKNDKEKVNIADKDVIEETEETQNEEEKV